MKTVRIRVKHIRVRSHAGPIPKRTMPLQLDWIIAVTVIVLLITLVALVFGR